jgi:pentatricopeptide repeat protein
MHLLEKSKLEFERDCMRHYDIRKKGDRTIEVQKLLSKYKELRKNFQKNGKQFGLEISQYSRLLDITYTPSGIPLRERLVLFQELHDDVQGSLMNSKSKKGQNILTALKILTCADKNNGVELSIAIAKKVPSCDPVILAALLYVRYLRMGSIATKKWMEQVVKDAWYYSDGPIYFKWTPRMCNTIVFYLSKDQHFTEALDFIKTMAKLKVKASVSTFNFILTSLTRSGRSEEAKKLFKEMEDQNITYDRLSFESMIESVLIPYARESLTNKSGNPTYY